MRLLKSNLSGNTNELQQDLFLEVLTTSLTNIQLSTNNFVSHWWLKIVTEYNETLCVA